MSQFILRHYLTLALVAVSCAVAVNVAAPLSGIDAAEQSTRDRSASSADIAFARAFPGTSSENVVSIVVEDKRASATPQRTRAISEVLRKHPEAVGSVLDMSADPLTASIAVSPKHHAGLVLAWLKGTPGSAERAQSVEVVRDAVASAPGDAPMTIAGPALDSANASQSAGRPAAWALAAVVIALAVAFFALSGSVSFTALVLLIASAALTIAIPVEILAGPRWQGNAPTWSLSLSVALTAAAALRYAWIIARQYGRGRRSGHDHRAALEIAYRAGLAPIAGSAAVIAGPVLVATVPGLPESGPVGVAAGIGVLVAAVLVVVLAPAWTALFGMRVLKPWGARVLPYGWLVRMYHNPSGALLGAGAVLITGLLALPTLGVDADATDHRHGQENAAGDFGSDPVGLETVLLTSDRDLRTPAGLIAVNLITNRLLEIPGVRRVQSAAAPSGPPWADATVAHQLGELNRQLQAQGTTALPLAESFTEMPSTLDRLATSLNNFDHALNVGSAALPPTEASLSQIVSSLDGIEAGATSVSRYADPLRDWMRSIPNCDADVLCPTVRNVIEPLDNVLAQASSIVMSSRDLSANSSAASESLRSARAALAAARRALDEIRPVAAGVAGSASGASPQFARATALINAMTVDLSANGAGGFYLPQSSIDAPEYAGVKSAFFSEDGTATRVFVYGARDGSVSAEIRAAVDESTKYGALVGSTTHTAGSSTTVAADEAHRLSDFRTTLLAIVATILVVAAVSSRSLALGLVVAAASAASYLATLGAFAWLTSVTTEADIAWWIPSATLVVVAGILGEDAWSLANQHRLRGRNRRQDIPIYGIAGLVWCAAVFSALWVTRGAVDYLALLAGSSIVVGGVVFRIGSICAAGLARRGRGLSWSARESASRGHSSSTA
ncbi:MMPL family transporter [Mycolicibacterium farcinogenes]|nr:MMPL family transporter [Mycolicibacterium farcinogenes]